MSMVMPASACLCCSKLQAVSLELADWRAGKVRGNEGKEHATLIIPQLPPPLIPSGPMAQCE